VGLAAARAYDLRGSLVSLLAWEGVPMVFVAMKIFEDFDPANRTSAQETDPCCP
jgi:hypothetical protein